MHEISQKTKMGMSNCLHCLNRKVFHVLLMDVQYPDMKKKHCMKNEIIRMRVHKKDLISGKSPSVRALPQ